MKRNGQRRKYVDLYESRLRNPVNHPLKLEDGNYNIYAKDFPKSAENFFIELEGRIDKSAIDKFVKVRSSVAGDQTNDGMIVKYWLSAILDKEKLQNDWKDVSMSSVTVLVRVSLNQVFSFIFPRTLQTYLQHTKSATIDDLMRELIDDNVLRRYLKVEHPYWIQQISYDETLKHGTFPDIINVNARVVTELTFSSPIAQGYLEFHKRNYTEEMKLSFRRKLNDKLRAVERDKVIKKRFQQGPFDVLF
jgi:hypothetical protein